MAKYMLSRQKIIALEFQTQQMYEALKQAINTGNYLDASYAKIQYWKVLDQILAQAFDDPAYIDWTGDIKENKFDRYLLQLITGMSASTLIEYITKCKKDRRPEIRYRHEREPPYQERDRQHSGCRIGDR